LSEASINLEKKKRENRKVLAKQEKEIEVYMGQVKGTTGQDKKFRVKVRQMENELEQTLKKINILDKSSRGKSNSATKILRTEFRKSVPRKPLYQRNNITPPSK
jgi:uncharacterized protein YoxC